MSKRLGQKAISAQLNAVVRKLVKDQLIEYTIPDKPNSRLQKYHLTDKGKTELSKLKSGNAVYDAVYDAVYVYWYMSKIQKSFREREGMHIIREHLRTQIPPLLTKWEPKMNVSVNEVRIKKMKTLWGSCTIEAKRIWLNLEQAKKPQSCLIYVLVHEMTHLLERHHNDRFRELMDTFLPKWRTYQDELNKAPLAHEN